MDVTLKCEYFYEFCVEKIWDYKALRTRVLQSRCLNLILPRIVAVAFGSSRLAILAGRLVPALLYYKLK